MARTHRMKTLPTPPPKSADKRGSTPFTCMGGRFQPSSVNLIMLSSETLRLAGYTDQHPPCVIITGDWPQMRGYKRQGFKLPVEEAIRFGRNILELCVEELNAQRTRRRQTPVKNAPAPSGRSNLTGPDCNRGMTRRPNEIGQAKALVKK